MSLPDSLPRLSSATLARADWRFLLPAPDLGAVLCVGAPFSVVAALRLIVAEPTVVGDLQHAPGGQYDTVVLSAPASGELAAAASLLRYGGWLYVEVDRPPLRALAWLPSALTPLWVQLARRAGLVDVRAHWYVAGPELATHLVPLGDRTALKHLAGRAQGSVAGRLKVLLLRLLVLLSLGGLPARHVALIARRDGGPS